MIRVVLITLIIGIPLAAIAYFRFKMQSEITPQSNIANIAQTSPLPSTIPAQIENTVDTGQSDNSLTPVTTQDNKRITTLETKVTDLIRRIALLEKATPTPATQQKQAAVYIPLGTTGSTLATDWTSIADLQVEIDTANYPNYKDMQLEVNMRVYQGNGESFARLFNYSDSTAILGSDVSTTSQTYTWVKSNGFRVPSGTKTYRVQLKSLTGYSADIQNARIKVNF